MARLTIELPDELVEVAKERAATGSLDITNWAAGVLVLELGGRPVGSSMRDTIYRAEWPRPVTHSAAENAQVEALRASLHGPGWPGVSADLPTRNALHDRSTKHPF